MDGVVILFDETIDPSSITDTFLSMISPWIGILAFIGVIVIGLFWAGFCLKYLFSDEEKKEELKEKIPKQIKGTIIAGTCLACAGTLLVSIGSVFGVDINLS